MKVHSPIKEVLRYTDKSIFKKKKLYSNPYKKILFLDNRIRFNGFKHYIYFCMYILFLYIKRLFS